MGDRIRAVLFDMDGTIIQNNYPFTKVKSEILEALSKRGVSVPEDLYGSIASLLLELKKLGVVGEELRGEILEILARHDEECTRGVRLRRGVAKLLRWLKSEGYRVGLISNSNLDVVLRVLKAKRIRGLFDVVVTREFVDRMKPYPDMVVLACRRLGVEPSATLVVGDSWVDLEAGLKAGAKTVYLNVRGVKPAVRPNYEAGSIKALLEILGGFGGSC